MGQISSAVIILLIALTACTSRADSKYRVCGHDFDLEIAKTQKSRAKGLMHREKLDPQKGMLFIFREAGPQSFWMKNVSIKLDILFFDSKGKLVSTDTMDPASPLMKDQFLPHYSSKGPAQFVVEIAGGSMKKWNAAALEGCRLLPLPKIDQSVEP